MTMPVVNCDAFAFSIPGLELYDSYSFFCKEYHRVFYGRLYETIQDCSKYSLLLGLSASLVADAVIVLGISVWAIAIIKKSGVGSSSQTQSPIVIYPSANLVCFT